MKALGLILLGLVLLGLLSVLSGAALMILFGNLSFIFASVPAISLVQALSISIPLGFIVGSFTATAKSN